MSSGAWREPTTLLPLRWGTYGGRYLGGLTLIFAGGVGLQGATPHTLHLLVLSTAAHAAGWFILPARGSRRIWVVALSVASIWLLLPGPQALTFLVLPFLGWLAVRQRPARSYPAALLVLGTGVLIANLFEEYTAMPIAMPIAVAMLVASAWLARLAAVGGRMHSNLDRPANTIGSQTVGSTGS